MENGQRAVWPKVHQTNSLWSITEIKFLLNCCCRDKSVPFNLSKYDSVHLSARFPFSSSTLLSVQRVTVFMKADYSPNGVPISAHLCRNGLYRASLITISNNLSLFDVWKLFWYFLRSPKDIFYTVFMNKLWL